MELFMICDHKPTDNSQDIGKSWGMANTLSLEAYKYKEYNIDVLIIMQRKEHIKFYPKTHFNGHNFSMA